METPKKRSQGKDNERDFTFNLDRPSRENIRDMARILLHWSKNMESDSDEEPPRKRGKAKK